MTAAPYARIAAWGLGLAAAAAVVVPAALRSQAMLLSGDGSVRWAGGTMTAIFAACLTAWGVAAWGGLASLGRLGNRSLVVLALLAALQLAASLAARLLDAALYALLGPFAVFLAGAGDEGLPTLLTTVAVTLVPRVGAVALLHLTMWMLMVTFTGFLGVIEVLYLTTSIVLHEVLLAIAGLTTGRALAQPAPAAPPLIVARLAIVLGLANGGALAVQFALAQVLSRLTFESWYLVAVPVCASLYGGAGAALGAVWGYRLRRIVT